MLSQMHALSIFDFFKLISYVNHQNTHQQRTDTPYYACMHIAIPTFTLRECDSRFALPNNRTSTASSFVHLTCGWASKTFAHTPTLTTIRAATSRPSSPALLSSSSASQAVRCSVVSMWIPHARSEITHTHKCRCTFVNVQYMSMLVIILALVHRWWEFSRLVFLSTQTLITQHTW